MKLNKNFIVHNSGGESLLVPTGEADFSGLVRGNKTLGAVLELPQTEATESAIVAALSAKFDAPERVITADEETALDKLRSIGALDE